MGFAQDEEEYLQPMPIDSFYLREVPDSVLLNLKKDRSFAYANDKAYWIHEEEEPSAFTEFFYYLVTHSWVKWLFLTGFTVILIIVLVNIIRSNQLSLFHAGGRKRHEDPGIEAKPEAFSTLIREAESAGDFRLAVRYHFLQTLQHLHEKQLITQHTDTTNQQYLAQLSNHPRFDAFRQLTLIYEYLWYGDFAIDSSRYKAVAVKFLDFNRLIS